MRSIQRSDHAKHALLETTLHPLDMTRREAARLTTIGIAMLLGPTAGQAMSTLRGRPVNSKLMCINRYQIDPYQKDAFKTYAQTLGPLIPRNGGHLLGYFLPATGTNDIGWGMIAFDSLASYEIYQKRVRTDPEVLRILEFAETHKFILREERNFVEIVDGTFERPAVTG
jgi:hypothetical protein